MFLRGHVLKEETVLSTICPCLRSRKRLLSRDWNISQSFSIAEITRSWGCENVRVTKDDNGWRIYVCSLRCLAEVLAGRAKCDLSTGDLEAASSQAERAFAIHKGCADAFLVRGQVRRCLSKFVFPLWCSVLFEYWWKTLRYNSRGGIHACIRYEESSLTTVSVMMVEQCRRELGDEDGALRDLVNAFVLRGTALNGAADGREAQAIEEVSREACKARAG